MQEPVFDKLQTEAAADMFAKMEAAESAVKRKLREMKQAEEILMLTEEEDRLIRSFRRFKANLRKAGEVFKWQTAPEPGVMISQETGLVRDPQEVS